MIVASLDRRRCDELHMTEKMFRTSQNDTLKLIGGQNRFDTFQTALEIHRNIRTSIIQSEYQNNFFYPTVPKQKPTPD